MPGHLYIIVAVGGLEALCNFAFQNCKKVKTFGGIALLIIGYKTLSIAIAAKVAPIMERIVGGFQKDTYGRRIHYR